MVFMSIVPVEKNIINTGFDWREWHVIEKADRNFMCFYDIILYGRLYIERESESGRGCP